MQGTSSAQDMRSVRTQPLRSARYPPASVAAMPVMESTETVALPAALEAPSTLMQ